MTEFIQRIPSPPVFTGDARQHLQAVLDDLPPLDCELRVTPRIGDDCQCGGVFRFYPGERRTYDHPGSEECIACNDCGEVAA